MIGTNRKTKLAALGLLAVMACCQGAAASAAEPYDALAQVNALRKARGLRPFVWDEGLTIAAARAAKFRADRLIEAHTRNDFQFLPRGVRADAAGCAAWSKGSGFGACCIYGEWKLVGRRWVFHDWKRAGAASCLGRDGRMYHHLFVGN